MNDEEVRLFAHWKRTAKESEAARLVKRGVGDAAKRRDDAFFGAIAVEHAALTALRACVIAPEEDGGDVDEVHDPIHALKAMKNELASDQFACPGGHRIAIPGHVSSSVGRDRALGFDAGLGQFVSSPYVEFGKCDGIIVIELDHESDDMGGVLYTYPVASSEPSVCARALGLTDGDDEYRDHIWGRYSERKRLLCVLVNICKNLGVYEEVFSKG